MNKTGLVILLLALMVMTTGCGRKGDLYLPEEPVAVQEEDETEQKATENE